PADPAGGSRRARGLLGRAQPHAAARSAWSERDARPEARTRLRRHRAENNENAAASRRRTSRSQTSWTYTLGLVPSASTLSFFVPHPQLGSGDDHRLLLGVVVKHLGAVLLPVARVLGAAERQLVVRDLDGVDPGVAGFQLVDRSLRLGQVAGEDARAEAEL